VILSSCAFLRLVRCVNGSFRVRDSMSVKGKAVLVVKTGLPDMDLANALTRSLLCTASTCSMST